MITKIADEPPDASSHKKQDKTAHSAGRLMEARVGVRKLEAIAAHRAMFCFKSHDRRKAMLDTRRIPVFVCDVRLQTK
jgi:hypothetical protein